MAASPLLTTEGGPRPRLSAIRGRFLPNGGRRPHRRCAGDVRTVKTISTYGPPTGHLRVPVRPSSREPRSPIAFSAPVVAGEARYEDAGNLQLARKHLDRAAESRASRLSQRGAFVVGLHRGRPTPPLGGGSGGTLLWRAGAGCPWGDVGLTRRRSS